MNLKHLIRIMLMMFFINTSQAETLSPQESQQIIYEELYSKAKNGDKNAREKASKFTDKEWNTAANWAWNSNNKHNFFYSDADAKVSAQIRFGFMDEKWYMVFDYANRKNITVNEFISVNLEANNGAKVKIYDKNCSDCVFDRSNDDFSFYTAFVELSDKEKEHIFNKIKNHSLITITYKTSEGYKHYKFTLKNSAFSLDKLDENYLLMRYINS